MDAAYRLYDKILGFWAEHGMPPTIRDMQRAMGYRSHGAIYRLTEILRGEGRLVPSKGKTRQLLPTELQDAICVQAEMLRMN